MGKQEFDSEQQPQMIDPRVMQSMYGMMPEEDEIDLLEYWNVIWKKKLLIIGVSLLAAILAAGVSLMMPNIYRAEALLAPVGGESNKGGLASALGGLGGIASLAGVSLGGSSSVDVNLAVLKSREFIWDFVKTEKLMPILFEDAWNSEAGKWKADDPGKQPTLWSAWRLMTGVLSTSVDKDSGLVHLSIDWKDPELAALWVTKLVKRLNGHLREQAIIQSQEKLKYLNDELAKTKIEENRNALFSLISNEQKQAMLANTQQDFAFSVIDTAVAPDKKIKPKRSIIVVLTMFVAAFLAIIFVFIQEGMRKRKEEEDAHEV